GRPAFGTTRSPVLLISRLISEGRRTAPWGRGRPPCLMQNDRQKQEPTRPKLSEAVHTTVWPLANITSVSLNLSMIFSTVYVMRGMAPLLSAPKPSDRPWSPQVTSLYKIGAGHDAPLSASLWPAIQQEHNGSGLDPIDRFMNRWTIGCLADVVRRFQIGVDNAPPIAAGAGRGRGQFEFQRLPVRIRHEMHSKLDGKTTGRDSQAMGLVSPVRLRLLDRIPVDLRLAKQL